MSDYSKRIKFARSWLRGAIAIQYSLIAVTKGIKLEELGKTPEVKKLALGMAKLYIRLGFL